jgi:hypothetical protein
MSLCAALLKTNFGVARSWALVDMMQTIHSAASKGFLAKAIFILDSVRPKSLDTV